MPISEALGRIEEIKNQIVELTTPAEQTPATTAVNSTSETEFATALGSVTDTVPSNGTATGESIVEEAKKYLGIPYVFGAESPEDGFDCSGLVQYVLKQQGIDAPRLAHEQATIGTEVQGGLANAQPGDLIVTTNSDHIVIYAGDGMVVHAPTEGRTVSYQKNWLTDSDIQTIRRVAPAATAAASNTASTQSQQIAELQKMLNGTAGTSTNSMSDLITAMQMSSFGK
ncbi:C40 family peptidase [Leifsonia sp. Leaf264]|uniref:C40 family peptidase n=1 Tax=Leifsonia sp. Leaf264 TaxID=1736314 RepID=UPI0006FBC611|nr:C40 family peptidase [Leifsonia sp. Leaf264]KQO98237.1 hypothetical protein ASF30_09250 [Leifsonia sp. Leaf264]